MVSPELLRRYPFFAELSYDNIVALADAADERRYEAGHVFFHEDEDLSHFYLVEEGQVAIVIDVPDRDAEPGVADQIAGDVKTHSVIVSTVGAGEVFGWSGLVPPQRTTAGAKAESECRVIEFDAQGLLELFEEDPVFGHMMTQKAARVIRRRLHDLRVESLATVA
jgi:CRP-like cAMP-binding protein